MTTEMIVSLGAIGVSFAGSFFNYYKLKDDQKTWEQEQKISMEKKILFRTLKKRYKLYGEIFKLLGKVRDIDYPKEHYQILEKDKKKLTRIADEILIELYGEAGLFMSYETRSAILKTYQNSYRYANNKIKLNGLIDSYYVSRRLLRKDLEFDDAKSAQTAKKILETSLKDIEDSIEIEFNWAKKGILAYSARPGYPNKEVSLKILKQTMDVWNKFGIKSIICLLSDEEINEYYEIIDYELLNFYKKHGFEVYHLSITDFQIPPIDTNQLKLIDVEYSKITKPTIIHCGAGEDRTGHLVSFLENKYNY